jgi:hypothetical protein
MGKGLPEEVVAELQQRVEDQGRRTNFLRDIREEGFPVFI